MLKILLQNQRKQFIQSNLIRTFGFSGKKLAPTKERQPQFSRPVQAVAGGMSVAAKARPDCVQEEQLIEAVNMMFQDNNLRLDKPGDLKYQHGMVHASQFADHFEGQLLMGAIAQDAIGWNPIGGWRIEAGGATGGCAVQAGALSVAAGVQDYTIILGWEKMSMVSTNQGTEFIALASDTDFDFEAGGNYTGYQAAMAQEHICTFGTTREHMSKVAVKNRNQAQQNPYAQTCHMNPFATKNTSGFINSDTVTNDFLRASCSPIHVLDCCQMSDAASSLLICSEELAQQLTDHPIKIRGIGSGTDTMRTGDRQVSSAGALLKKGVFFPDRNLLLPHEDNPETIKKQEKIKQPLAHSFLAGRSAALEAQRMAGITDPMKQLSWLETHDAFTSSELQAIEDFGVAPYGEGGKFMDTAPWDDEKKVFKEKFPQFGFGKDKLGLTYSGGLIGARHGVGDTGVFQVVDTMWRLQGKIQKFMGKEAQQPEVKTGTLAADHSHAGTGAYVTITILERPDIPEQKHDEKEGQVQEKVYEKIQEQRENAGKATSIRLNTQEEIPKGSDLLDPKDKKLGMRQDGAAGATIIHNPQKIDQYKTRGRVSPFFDGLSIGELRATQCKDHGVYMAPIANCRDSDCLKDISETWTDLSSFTAYIQTWTSMHQAGPSWKNDLPFHNILAYWTDDLALTDAVSGATVPNTEFKASFMSRLRIPDWFKEEEIQANMAIVPKFNTANPKGRMQDVWFEPAFTQDEWHNMKGGIADLAKGQYSHTHGGPKR